MHIGELQVHPVTDGTFVARPHYFGADAATNPHPELFDRDGAAWLPIGCFLIRSGERIVLIDAGLGPDLQDGLHLLVGGQLLTGLRALDVDPDDVTDVVCTHMHADHVGWLFDLDGDAVFRRAAIWFGAADFPHFVTGTGEMAAHIRCGFTASRHASRLRPIDHDTTIASGITAITAPGHTPGHLCIALSSGQERALLLGDAITCPVQLDEPTWHSLGDVDPALADRTREHLWRELEGEHITGVGAHFPELRFGRVLPGSAPRRWLT